MLHRIINFAAAPSGKTHQCPVVISVSAVFSHSTSEIRAFTTSPIEITPTIPLPSTRLSGVAGTVTHGFCTS